MEAPRKGDCYLVTAHHHHRPSSVLALIQPYTQQRSAINYTVIIYTPSATTRYMQMKENQIEQTEA